MRSKGNLEREIKFRSDDLAALRELQLLTAKPFLYAFNMDEGELGDEALRKRLADLRELQLLTAKPFL
jgi:ribosome-binding ATPase YchF (GTP1/OBG family)